MPSQSFVLPGSKNFTSDQEIRIPPAAPINPDGCGAQGRVDCRDADARGGGWWRKASPPHPTVSPSSEPEPRWDTRPLLPVWGKEPARVRPDGRSLVIPCLVHQPTQRLP